MQADWAEAAHSAQRLMRGVRDTRMRKLYPQRKAASKTELIYAFDDRVRQRMLTTLQNHVSGDVWAFLGDLDTDLVKAYGYLQRSAYDVR
jgi:hypothetical protein